MSPQHAHDVAVCPGLAAKEGLHYREALLNGYRRLSERPLATQTAIEVCGIIHGSPCEDP